MVSNLRGYASEIGVQYYVNIQLITKFENLVPAHCYFLTKIFTIVKHIHINSILKYLFGMYLGRYQNQFYIRTIFILVHRIQTKYIPDLELISTSCFLC